MKNKVDAMDTDEALLSIPINPNNFPAKLWRLVNSPNKYIRWDTSGEGVLIDQYMFEAELLSPSKPSGELSDLFKTTNFTSFIRQLNLYGFRKVTHGPNGLEKHSDSELIANIDGNLHHFYNPNFKQGHPELLLNLKRLTSNNKAKMEAGLEVNCRPPNRLLRMLNSSTEGEKKTKVEKGGSVFVGQMHQRLPRDNASPYQYHTNGSQPRKDYDRTPIPSRGWSMVQDAASSPTAFYTDKGIPVSVIRHYAGDPAFPMESSPPSAVHVQQGSQNVSAARQQFSSFMPYYTQFRPDLYPTAVCQCCNTSPVDPHTTGCGNQAHASIPKYGFYQQNYPMGFLQTGNPNPDWQAADNEVRKTDVSLDKVFQTMEKFQTSPKLHVLKMDSPEKRRALLPTEPKPTSSTSFNPAQLSSHDQAAPAVPMPTTKDANPVPSSNPVPRDGVIVAGPAGITAPGEPRRTLIQGPASRAHAVPVMPSLKSEQEETPISDETDLNLLVEVACKEDP